MGRLGQQFGASNVFFDRADIEQGQLWCHEVKRQIGAADVVIAVIGPNWPEILQARMTGDDVLRFELASAIEQKKHIIPVLVGATPMPERALLPPDVKTLADLQALAITPDDLDRAMRELLGRLKPGFGVAVSWAFANISGCLIGLLVLVFALKAFGALDFNQQIEGPSMHPVLASAITGALVGVCVGVPQWLVLRAWFDRARFLVPVYVLLSIVAIGFAVTSTWADLNRGMAVTILMMVLLPVGLGATLWWIVRTQLIHAGWWSVANMVAPFAGLMIAGSNHVPTEKVQGRMNPTALSDALSSVVYFSMPMLVLTLLSGFLLVWLMRVSEIKCRR